MKSVQQKIVIFCILNLLFLPQPSVAGRIDELSSMAKQGQVEAQFALAEAYYFANGIERICIRLFLGMKGLLSKDTLRLKGL